MNLILIPVYNDWKSVSKLLDNIDDLSLESKFTLSIIIINDASNHDRSDEVKEFKNIQSLKIINMRKNQGHARCIATGLKYIFERKDFDFIIPISGETSAGEAK